MSGSAERGLKYDDGKPRMDLVPPEFVEAVAQVLGHGAQKYDEWNWAKGLKYGRVIAAAERHIGAWKRGEDVDPESGLPHLAHAACCLAFLICYQKWGLELLDDRFVRPIEEAKPSAQEESDGDGRPSSEARRAPRPEEGSGEDGVQEDAT